jgi:uncharacterized protein (TIGR01777 family)
MRILISGSHGLIGKAVVEALQAKNHQVVSLVRNRDEVSQDSLLFDPEHTPLDSDSYEGFDACINLAGESVAQGRWTEEKKRKIRDSRVLRTRILSEFLSGLKNPPKIFLSASAIGYYGSSGDRVLNESSKGGTDFLATVCKNWEKSTTVLENKGVRVVHLRTGVVLSKEGGALAKMLVPFKLGLGGKIGSGSQYMSWIALEDEVSAILFCLENSKLSGAVNLVCPNPVTNGEFTKVLGKALARPTLFPMPAFVAKLLMGKELAEELLLASQRAVPQKLLEAGFTFKYPGLKSALEAILHHNKTP